MVDYLRRCALDPDQPRPSIETLLHAFVRRAHVDHTHPDAVIALTSSPDGRSLAEEAFGDDAVWLDYQRPGFDMSKRIAELLDANPSARAVLLERHGLVTWGDDARGGLQEHHRVRHESCRDGRAGPEPAGSVSAVGRARSSGRASASPSWRRHFPRSAARSSPTRTASCSRSTAARRPWRSPRRRGRPRSARSGALPRPPDQHEAQAARRRVRPGDRRRRRARRGVPTRRRGVRTWYREYYGRNLDDETRRFPIDPVGPRVIARPRRRHRDERARRRTGALRPRPLPPGDRRPGRRRRARRIPLAQRGGGVRDRVLAARALQARAGAAARRARRAASR